MEGSQQGEKLSPHLSPFLAPPILVLRKPARRRDPGLNFAGLGKMRAVWYVRVTYIFQGCAMSQAKGKSDFYNPFIHVITFFVKNLHPTHVS